MAEAFAIHYGAGVVTAASSGLAPANSIALETRASMQEKSIDLVDQFPKEFVPSVAERYDVIVNMSGFLLPAVHGPLILEWDVDDPFGEPMRVHRRVRDEVEERVRDLLREIAAGEPIGPPAGVGQRIAAEQARKPRLWQRFTKRR